MHTDSSDLRSTPRIDVAIDFTSADSFLALDPVIELARELETDLWFQPFRVRQNPVPRKLPNEGDAQRHRRLRAEYRKMDSRRYAKIRGLELRANPSGVDPTLAHLGLILANDEGVGLEFSRSVFDKFWKGELNLACEDAIASELLVHGIRRTESLHDTLPQLASLRRKLLAKGVFSVPTFLLGPERYIGRQHLPMIRDLLTV